MEPKVLQLRLVVEADDYDAALTFYRDVLGLREEEAYQDGDARVVILGAGRATLEIVNSAQKALIDRVEVGRAVAPHMRVAFEVPDSAATTQALAAAGAQVVEGYPVEAGGTRVDLISGYVGSVELFEAAGFRRASPTTAHSGHRDRWLMRKEL